VADSAFDLGDHPLRVFGEIEPGEAKDLVSRQGQIVLLEPIPLEGFVIGVESQPIDLDGDLENGKEHTDLPASEPLVGLPAGDLRLPQQLDQESFCFGVGTAVGGLQ
jgi:hypothetical protein